MAAKENIKLDPKALDALLYVASGDVRKAINVLQAASTTTEKVSEENLRKAEAIINEQIKKDLPVHFEMLSLEEAKERGAIGLFEDKYAQLGGKVKVYFVGTPEDLFSKEVCGGPHVEHLGQLGEFKILKEEAVAAGIRRIKAVVTGI